MENPYPAQPLLTRLDLFTPPLIGRTAPPKIATPNKTTSQADLGDRYRLAPRLVLDLDEQVRKPARTTTAPGTCKQRSAGRGASAFTERAGRAAADVFTESTTTWVLFSIQLDLGYGMQVQP